MAYFYGNELRAPTLLFRGEYRASRLYLGLLGFRGVAQLVARTAGGREVASSSLVTPTIYEINKEYRGAI